MGDTAKRLDRDDGRNGDDRLDHVDVGLDRDLFLREALNELSAMLDDVVGRDEADRFIGAVAQSLGERLDERYRRALRLDRLPRALLARVLVDVKRRIGGDFRVIEDVGDRIVLGNRACPFGAQVHDRPSLCMMTSGLLGTMVAESQGAARVALERTIARGDPQCRIVIRLGTDSGGAGVLYFGPAATAEPEP